MSESTSAEQLAAQPPVSKEERERASIALVPATGFGMPPTAQGYYAVVTSTGQLIRGLGAVAAIRFSVGTYQVLFDHDLTLSGYSANIGLPYSVGTTAPGFITVMGRTGVPNAAFVQTYDTSGNLADRSFQIAVGS